MTDTKSKPTIKQPNHIIIGHFLWSDLVCPCCDMLKIVPALYRHMVLLEQLQADVGFPLRIMLGHCCARYNKRIGGPAKSWHLLFATDVCPDANIITAEMMREIYMAALESEFGGIGRYDNHIHLDLRPERLIWRG